MDRRILLALGTVAAAVVLFVVLRPDDADDTASMPATATTPTTTSSTPATETTPTTTASEPEGERVVLVVRSDVADHVHVHGVDIFQDVAPGVPARLQFRPRAPGVLEIELEDRHLLIVQLEVKP
jgi:cytoskeletal protein RodZ